MHRIEEHEVIRVLYFHELPLGTVNLDESHLSLLARRQLGNCPKSAFMEDHRYISLIAVYSVSVLLDGVS